MNTYEKYFGNIEKAIKAFADSDYCPSFLGLQNMSEGTGLHECTDYCDTCWRQALEQETEEAKELSTINEDMMKIDHRSWIKKLLGGKE